MITIRWWELILGICAGEFISGLFNIEEVGRRWGQRLALRRLPTATPRQPGEQIDGADHGD